MHFSPSCHSNSFSTAAQTSREAFALDVFFFFTVHLKYLESFTLFTRQLYAKIIEVLPSGKGQNIFRYFFLANLLKKRNWNITLTFVLRTRFYDTGSDVSTCWLQRNVSGWRESWGSSWVLRTSGLYLGFVFLQDNDPKRTDKTKPVGLRDDSVNVLERDRQSSDLRMCGQTWKCLCTDSLHPKSKVQVWMTQEL